MDVTTQAVTGFGQYIVSYALDLILTVWQIQSQHTFIFKDHRCFRLHSLIDALKLTYADCGNLPRADSLAELRALAKPSPIPAFSV